jgi:hypothetical protein
MERNVCFGPRADIARCPTTFIRASGMAHESCSNHLYNFLTRPEPDETAALIYFQDTLGIFVGRISDETENFYARTENLN